MRAPMSDIIEFLRTRRSVKPREMSGPCPSAEEIETVLTIGARVPDHGKVVPWRFIVFEGDGRVRAGDVIARVYASKNPSAPQEEIEIEKTPVDGSAAGDRCGELHKATPQCAVMGTGVVGRGQRHEYRHGRHRARLWSELADRLVRLRS